MPSYKRIGLAEIEPVHEASCHCGAVRMRLTLPNGVVNPSRCNCSFCKRRGAIAGTALLHELEVVQGEESLSLYQFNSDTAMHYFCSVCGNYTHHKRRSNPNEYGYNVACLEGVDPFLLDDVPTTDGQNHPADR